MGILSMLFGSNKKEELESFIDQGAKIIDVRTVQEYRSGHHPNSINIPLNTIDSKIETILKWNNPVIIVCKSGGRARMAQKALGKSDIQCMNGDAWQSLM